MTEAVSMTVAMPPQVSAPASAPSASQQPSNAAPASAPAPAANAQAPSTYNSLAAASASTIRGVGVNTTA